MSIAENLFMDEIAEDVLWLFMKKHSKIFENMKYYSYLCS